jgi:hypothetical protein
MPSERSERVLTSLFLALRSKARGEEPEQIEPFGGASRLLRGLRVSGVRATRTIESMMNREAPPVVKTANHPRPSQSKVRVQGNE